MRPRGDDLRSENREVSTRHVEERDRFRVDPALVERGLAGHAETRNALAEASPKPNRARSPRPEDPNFDLAWRRDDAIFVAEIKSIARRNEERQLRLGLGHVLRYRSLIRMPPRGRAPDGGYVGPPALGQ